METVTIELAKKLYEVYNEAGENKWKNFSGKKCPDWEALPKDVQDKWCAVAMIFPPAVRMLLGGL